MRPIPSQSVENRSNRRVDSRLPNDPFLSVEGVSRDPLLAREVHEWVAGQS